jgi:hypothetical protein
MTTHIAMADAGWHMDQVNYPRRAGQILGSQSASVEAGGGR